MTDSDLPEDSIDETIAVAMEFALLAPSPRNIQPWAFMSHDEGIINMYFDRSRSRSVGDPLGRELVISCGVALYFLRIALDSLGADYVIAIYPDPRLADLLARIRVTGTAKVPDVVAQELVTAASARHTNWGGIDDVPLEAEVLEELGVVATELQTKFTVVQDAQRSQVEELIVNSNHLQMADPRFVEELKRWPVGRPTAPAQGAEGSVEHSTSGTLVAISTYGDTEDQWLLAGQSLAHVLLAATGLGVAITFANQPLQVDVTRREVERVLCLDADPQQLLRLGYTSESPNQTDRRSIDEVTEPLSEPW